MIIDELQMTNFFSYRNQKISFDKDLYMIIGEITGTNKSNGSGKSTIARGIKYALYGDTNNDDRTLKIRNDDMIYNDADQMEVKLKFTHNGQKHKISRVVRRGNSPIVYISINGGKDVKYGIKDGQALINDILGTNANIYLNTAYFQQGDLNSFSRLTPKDAKDVVIKILQLDVYNNYEQAAKERVSLVKSEIAKLKGKVENLKDLIEKEKATAPESKYTKEDLTRVQSKLKEIKFEQRMENFLENSRKKSMEVLDSQITKANGILRDVNYDLQTKEKRIKKLLGLSNDKYCPTCEHLLNEEDINSIIDSIRTDIEKARPKQTDAVKVVNALTDSKKSLRSLDFSIVNQIDLAKYAEELGQIKAELNKQKQDKKKIHNLKKEIDAHILDIGLKENLLNMYTKLQTAFGRKGIQAYIIENVIPEIQTTANDILQSLDTPIRLNINSQKNLKKGGKAETLDINVITKYGERPYSNYSGGQKTFIDFAIRMALSAILARRSNSQIQTLILDEVFGELDSVNKRTISMALKYISKKFNFKKILIISHAEELQDTCADIIRVVFDGMESTIEKKESK